MARIHELADKRDALADEISKLGAKTKLTPGEEEHFDRCTRQYDKVVRDLETLESRAARVDDIARRMDAGDPSIRILDGIPKSAYAVDDRALAGVQGAALRALDRVDLPPRSVDIQEQLVRRTRPTRPTSKCTAGPNTPAHSASWCSTAPTWPRTS